MKTMITQETLDSFDRALRAATVEKEEIIKEVNRMLSVKEVLRKGGDKAYLFMKQKVENQIDDIRKKIAGEKLTMSNASIELQEELLDKKNQLDDLDVLRKMVIEEKRRERNTKPVYDHTPTWGVR